MRVAGARKPIRSASAANRALSTMVSTLSASAMAKRNALPSSSPCRQTNSSASSEVNSSGTGAGCPSA
jgi:hypothetical protein